MRLLTKCRPVDLGRIAAQSAKQVILQKVREAERDRQYEEFKDRKGTIINGQVKREEYGNIIVDIGRGEAILRRNEKIGRESYRPNDRIRAYIKDVRREARGPQVFLAAPTRSSWRNCSRWKCRKFMTASSRSRRLPVIRAVARQDRRDFAMTTRLTRWALALVCAAAGCRPW